MLMPKLESPEDRELADIQQALGNAAMSSNLSGEYDERILQPIRERMRGLKLKGGKAKLQREAQAMLDAMGGPMMDHQAFHGLSNVLFRMRSADHVS